jgi:hypothetical protein
MCVPPTLEASLTPVMVIIVWVVRPMKPAVQRASVDHHCGLVNRINWRWRIIHIRRIDGVNRGIRSVGQAAKID